METRSFELFGVNQKETNKPKKKGGGGKQLEGNKGDNPI